VIDEGTTGFVIESIDEAVNAVARIGEIDRAECRRVFEKRFDVTRMAHDYLEVYRRLQPCQHEALASADFHAHSVQPPEPVLGVI
jgi:hypothetical protein